MAARTRHVALPFFTLSQNFLERVCDGPNVCANDGLSSQLCKACTSRALQCRAFALPRCRRPPTHACLVTKGPGARMYGGSVGAQTFKITHRHAHTPPKTHACSVDQAASLRMNWPFNVCSGMCKIQYSRTGEFIFHFYSDSLESDSGFYTYLNTRQKRPIHPQMCVY